MMQGGGGLTIRQALPFYGILIKETTQKLPAL